MTYNHIKTVYNDAKCPYCKHFSWNCKCALKYVAFEPAKGWTLDFRGYALLKKVPPTHSLWYAGAMTDLVTPCTLSILGLMALFPTHLTGQRTAGPPGERGAREGRRHALNTTPTAIHFFHGWRVTFVTEGLNEKLSIIELVLPERKYLLISQRSFSGPTQLSIAHVCQVREAMVYNVSFPGSHSLGGASLGMGLTMAIYCHCMVIHLYQLLFCI